MIKILVLTMVLALSGWLSSKESACNAGNADPCVGKIPWRRKWQPLQYYCLENPMDRGAWRATVHGIARSQTRLSIHTHMVLEEQDFKDEISELLRVFWNGPSNLIRFKDANIFS